MTVVVTLSRRHAGRSKGMIGSPGFLVTGPTEVRVYHASRSGFRTIRIGEGTVVEFIVRRASFGAGLTSFKMTVESSSRTVLVFTESIRE